MFTSHFITGSDVRPDYRFIAVHVENSLADIKEGSILYNRATIADYIPIVSVLSGSCKVVFGLIHLVDHIAKAILDPSNSAQYHQEMSLAGKNICRGLVAMVPIIGNLAVSVFDSKRIDEEIKSIVKFEKGFAILYSGGKEIGRKTSTEYYQEKKLRNPSAVEWLEFMRPGSSIEDRPAGGLYEQKHSVFRMRAKSLQADESIMSIYDWGGTYLDVALA